MDYIY